MTRAVATVTLTLNKPLSEVDRDQFKRVEAALKRWGGRLKPDDPLYEMFSDIKVTRFKLMAPNAEYGHIGGSRRAERMSPERRSEIARKAALARWGDKKEKKK